MNNRSAERPPTSHSKPGLLLKAGFLVLFVWLIFNLDGLIVSRSDVADSDFSVLWAGGRAVVSGYSPYDQTQTALIFNEIGHHRQPFVTFPYPIWTVIIFIPLGWLPVQTAAAAWAVLNQFFFLAAFLLIKSALRSYHSFTLKQGRRWNNYLLFAGFVPFLLTPHFIHSLLNGQTSFLITLLVACFIFLITRSPLHQLQSNLGQVAALNQRVVQMPVPAQLWAGLALVAWLLKPALVLIALPLMLVWLYTRRAWLVLLTAAAALLGMTLASLVVYSGWVVAWLDTRTSAELGEVATSSNIWGMFEELGRNFGFAQLALPLAGLACLGLGVVNWLVLRRQTNPVIALSVLYCFGLATTLYSHNYDQLTLFLPGLALLDLALGLPRMQRILVWANLATILLIIPWLLNIQALNHSVAGFYALSLNLFALILLGMTGRPVYQKELLVQAEYANAS